MFAASPVCPFAVLALETIDAAQRRFLCALHFHNRTMHGQLVTQDSTPAGPSTSRKTV